ncbi:hypothetical protein Desaci_3907 [Desulfosporosinus acidiphilus SJ4]|uniref:Uncharacterized protein n=1 Tax=Desulfosporosinus acidiphilus (strain DSM 22704 / JCM 16185 / SJ4) TaxID=646529 RepID=I4DAF9_DESAJ|nr:hypothetical protein [Desulfosporosinus acidiphilus]AFM42783.1 hypothetical protein Desaci_3907 [Desulfosporosinus acidiphilus SJ4]
MCGGGRNWMYGFGGGCGGGTFGIPHQRSYNTEGYSDRELIRREVNILYAQGTIGRDQYYTVLDQMERGLFTLDDLAHLRETTRQRESIKETPKIEHSTTVDLSEIKNLESKKAELSTAKQQINTLITEIKQSYDQLANQMKLEERFAEESIALDEQKARDHLMHRQELMEQSSHLEIRIKELASDLKQLEALEIKVEAKILERKALAQREKIKNLESELS